MKNKVIKNKVMKNKYTGNEVDPIFVNLQYTTQFKLNPYDRPYFAVRSRKEKIGLKSGGFQDPFKDIDVEVYGVIEDHGQNPAITAELNFLKMLDLVAQRDKKYYIHKNAEIFYVERTNRNGQAVKAIFDPKNDDKQQQELSMRRLLRRYTLPGRFWRNYYLGLYLPNDTKQKSRVQDEMVQIEEEFLGLQD